MPRRADAGVLAVSLMLAWTAGCAEKQLIISQPLPPGSTFPPTKDEFVNIVYSLPKTIVAVVGKPVTAASDNTGTKVAAVVGAPAGAAAAAAPAGGMGAAPPPPPAAAAGPVDVVAPPGVGADPPPKPAAAPAAQQYTITPAILPDRNARFLLRYWPGQLEDDTVTLEADSNGLLKTSSTNSVGRQGDILVALAQTATAVATLGTGSLLPTVPGGLGAAPGAASSATKTPACIPVTSFSVTFELGALHSPVQLPDCNYISIDWQPAAASVQAPASTPAAATCPFSVCYRTLMPVHAIIQEPAAVGSALVLASASFVAVDPELTAGLNLNSAPLVTRQHTVSFSSGLLTSAMVNDPSVALAVAKLPLTIITALLSAPASILSLKVTNTTDATSLATQQKALLDAQTALIKDIAATRAAQQSPVAGSGAR